MPVEHNRMHPDVHRPWAEWSEEKVLHVASPYSNPFRWRTRRLLANDFRRHMLASKNVSLHLGELAYGERPFEVTHKAQCSQDVQLRTPHELFHKENILNAIVKTFPADWKYGAIIDADFHFTRHDWALEAIHQLQHHDFVQLFSSYTDLSGDEYGTAQIPTRITSGFAYNWIRNGYRLPEGYSAGGWKGPAGTHYGYNKHHKGMFIGATGGAWAFRRSAFDAVGGLLDKCILGHADWFMAFGLAGYDAPDMHSSDYTDDYRNYILAWQRNAARLKANIGYVDGHAAHFFHGSKYKRGYETRDQILVAHKFQPTFDLMSDYQGIYQLTPDKPQLRDAIRRYFISRNEDNPNREPEKERHLI